MKTKTTQLNWREGRRQRAWELNEHGWKQQDLAAARGVPAGAVSPWLTRGREQGVDGLRRQPAPGRQPRRSAAQRAALPALVDRGPEADGCRGQVGTGKRVAAGIRRTCGVSSHPAHGSRLWQAVRHSVPRPGARAAQRNAAAIQPWWRERGPAREKKRPPKGARSSGSTHRAAPCGPWPGGPGRRGGRRRCCACRALLTIARRSAASRRTGAGSSETPARASHAPDVVRFLRGLRRTIRGTLLVIGDGSPIPRGQPITECLRRGGARRVHLEQVPGYAPELHPDAGIWNELKRVELGNLCCRDLAELALALRRAKERLRHKRSVIQACFLQAGYHV